MAAFDVSGEASALAQRAWAEIVEEVVPDTVLFLDDGAAESLRWGCAGGLAKLLEKGALGIYQVRSRARKFS